MDSTLHLSNIRPYLKQQSDYSGYIVKYSISPVSSLNLKSHVIQFLTNGIPRNECLISSYETVKSFFLILFLFLCYMLFFVYFLVVSWLNGFFVFVVFSFNNPIIPKSLCCSSYYLLTQTLLCPYSHRDLQPFVLSYVVRERPLVELS